MAEERTYEMEEGPVVPEDASAPSGPATYAVRADQTVLQQLESIEEKLDRLLALGTEAQA